MDERDGNLRPQWMIGRQGDLEWFARTNYVLVNYDLKLGSTRNDVLQAAIWTNLSPLYNFLKWCVQTLWLCKLLKISFIFEYQCKASPPGFNQLLDSRTDGLTLVLWKLLVRITWSWFLWPPAVSMVSSQKPCSRYQVLDWPDFKKLAGSPRRQTNGR